MQTGPDSPASAAISNGPRSRVKASPGWGWAAVTASPVGGVSARRVMRVWSSSRLRVR